MSEQDKSSSTSKSASSETMSSTSKSISNMTRIQRNVAEKQRRDKLNGYISELANIVPMVSMSSKRLDKTSILRLSAAHLRLSKSPLSGTKKLKKSFKWCPSFLTSQQVREILESVDGFLIVTSSSGKILFTSGSVERYLGHQNIDMIGHSLFVFIHPEDLDSVKEEMERLLTASLKCDDSSPAPRCSFRCRMKEKGQPRSEVATYQFVHFAGDMTISNDEETSSKSIKSTAVVTHIFKAFVRIVEANPYSQLSLEDATADEYVTRHSLDGTIIFADHRLSTITGHLPQEVTGLSAYKYILPEDISIALFAHHLMFSSDNGTGMIVYRLRTRDDKYVYLKSVGCLQFDRATSQVDHFVCVNQYLSDIEGEAQLKYFVDRFIPHIQDSSELTLFESVKALQVTGLKSPNSIGGIKEPLHFKKHSSIQDPNVGKSNIKSHNLQNTEASKLTFVHVSNISESTNSTASYDELSSNSGATQLSSPINTFPVKNNSIKANVVSSPKDLQFKNKSTTTNETQSVTKKRRANGNDSIKMTAFSVPENSVPKDTSISPQLQVEVSDKIQSSKALHVSLQTQNVSIKREISCTVNNSKDNMFSVETKRLQCENHTDFSSDFQELSNHTNNQIIDNSNSEQMHVSEIGMSNHLTDNSFQISQADDAYNKLDQYSMKKEYDFRVIIDSKTANTVNIHSIGTENFPGVKSNIMLSTGSVLYKSDSKISKEVVSDSNEFIKLGIDAFATNQIKLDSNQLSANINEVVMETNLWPAETSSESSASNAVSEETFASSVECCGDDHNLYFMPEEEMKDYLESSDDISSILNSSLPFDDSSLPSVDGWSECFIPEDVISTPTNTEVSVHVKRGNNH